MSEVVVVIGSGSDDSQYLVAFRWTHRKVSDECRAVVALRQGDGVRLKYRA